MRNLPIAIFFCLVSFAVINCTLANHRNNPLVQINFKDCSVTSIDPRYLIDSVCFETENFQQLFSLKQRGDSASTINLCADTIKNLVNKGSYTSVCGSDRPVIKVFLKEKKHGRLFYASTYYNCQSDSAIVIKCIGDI